MTIHPSNHIPHGVRVPLQDFTTTDNSIHIASFLSTSTDASNQQHHASTIPTSSISLLDGNRAAFLAEQKFQELLAELADAQPETQKYRELLHAELADMLPKPSLETSGAETKASNENQDMSDTGELASQGEAPSDIAQDQESSEKIPEPDGSQSPGGPRASSQEALERLRFKRIQRDCARRDAERCNMFFRSRGLPDKKPARANTIMAARRLGPSRPPMWWARPSQPSLHSDLPEEDSRQEDQTGEQSTSETKPNDGWVLPLR